MNKHQISIATGVVILLGILGWYAIPKQGEDIREAMPMEGTTAELSLTNRELFPAEILATQNQEITVHVLSDEDGEFHISGYERVFPLTKKGVSTFVFRAYKQGRFALEFHPVGSEMEHAHGEEDTDDDHQHEDISIGTLVVIPQ